MYIFRLPEKDAKRLSSCQVRFLSPHHPPQQPVKNEGRQQARQAERPAGHRGPPDMPLRPRVARMQCVRDGLGDDGYRGTLGAHLGQVALAFLDFVFVELQLRVTVQDLAVAGDCGGQMGVLMLPG